LGGGGGPVARYNEGPSVDDVFRVMKVVSLRMETLCVCAVVPDSERTVPATSRDHHARDVNRRRRGH
jgi:hypothetical protein